MSISKMLLCITISVLAALLIVVNDSVADQPASKGDLSKPFEVPDLKMTLLRIPSGEFDMGSPANEPNRSDIEFQHKVRLTKPFYIQSTEVTQAQYKIVMGENPSYFHGDDLPVENTSWDDAVHYCEKLSQRIGKKCRLLTEAEWEYAVRAGKVGPIAGSGKLDDISWYADNSGRDHLDSASMWDHDPNNYFGHLLDNGCGPHKVATRKPNSWGIYDMQGNMTEWVADWFSADYFREGAAKVDPLGPKESPAESRVMRGASWGSDPRNCRVAHRDWNVPSTKTDNCGFRVAMDAE